MVIVSFLFFGTYSAIQTDVTKEEDSIIGKVLDGSGLHSRDVNRLGRFLGTDFHDPTHLKIFYCDLVRKFSELGLIFVVIR